MPELIGNILEHRNERMEVEDAVNNNYVTSSSQPSGQLMCDRHEHFGIHVINEIFHINIDEVFTYLFTDSPIFQEFIQIRNTYDVNLGQWSDEPDENGIKTRFIAYTLSINYSIGPKCSPSTETQRLLPESQPGLFYLIDADCYNGGVPYADDFFTTIRYCITKINENQTRLQITGRVTYKRHIWGLIKTLIDKTANTGLATSFGVMATLLRRESERRKAKTDNRQSINSQKIVDNKSLSASQRNYAQPKGNIKERVSRHSPRRRQIPCGSSYRDNSRGTRRRATVHSGKADALYSSTTDILAKSVFIVVVFLVIVNLALFYQMSLLEATVARAVTKYNIR